MDSTEPQSHTWRQIGIKQVDFGLNDGKLDALERYFLDTGAIDRLKSRRSFFVLGRKGTGKTAIAKHLTDLSSSWSHFSAMLSLREVPVKLIEEFEDSAQTQSGRFVLVWQFILLIELAKLVIKDAEVSPADAAKLEAILLTTTPSLSASPDVYLKQTRERGYKVNVGKSGVFNATLEGKNVVTGGTVDLIDFTDALRNHLLATARIGKSYRVIIDELDDSYADSKEYYDLIIALFKAAMILNFSASQARKDVTALVALRDDIFDSVNYSDKNKWSDMSMRVDWLLKPGEKPHQSNLFKMINLRIGASLEDEPTVDKRYWRAMFESLPVRSDVKPFPYILSRSLYRPRDVIQFCKCIQDACPSGAKVATAKEILAAELPYSEWLLAEIVDEIHVKLPKIRDIFEAFRRLKKASFGAKEVATSLRQLGFKDMDAVNRVLGTLYDFSVIGQFDEGATAPIFRYRNPLRKFEADKRFSIHYGLRSTLRVY
jgi:hypothetical protein